MRTLLSLLSFPMMVCLAQIEESESFLRARQVVEADLLQSLNDGIVKGHEMMLQHSTDEQGRSLFLQADDICAQIESSIKEDVTCECSWQWFFPGFNFKCSGQERVNTLGLEGLRVYTGYIGALPLSLGGEIEAKVCVTDGDYKGIALKWDLCLDGVLCGGILSLGSGGVCSCKVKYGPASCACEPCSGGITTSCGPFSLVDICIPLPLTGGL